MIPPTAGLFVGEFANLVASIQQPVGSPTATVSFSTSDPLVATVDVAGRATAVAVGLATITARARSVGALGFTASDVETRAQVIVATRGQAISNLTVSPVTGTISVGQSLTLTTNVNRASSAVQTAYEFTSASPAIAAVTSAGIVTGITAGIATLSVRATGIAPGYTTTSLLSVVTISVQTQPGIRSLTVQPPSVQVSVGGTFTLTYVADQPAGAPPAVFQFITNSASVATVDAAGKVAGVSAGSTVITVTATSSAAAAFSAQSFSRQVAVAVFMPQVAVFAANQDTLLTTVFDSSTATGRIRGILVIRNLQVGQPIDISNARDIVRFDVNASVGQQRIDSMIAVLMNADGTNGGVIERQGGSNAGLVRMAVNTARFVVDIENGTATPVISNGSRRIRFVAWFTEDGAQRSAQSNPMTMFINNLDGFALALTPPARTLNDGNGRPWWGGDGTQGVGSFTVIPVMYSSGRSIASAIMSFGRCAGTVTRTARPFKVTFGGVGSGADINCGGVTGAYDAADNFRAEDYPMLLSTRDNPGNEGPAVIYVYNPTAGSDPYAGPRPGLWLQNALFPSPAPLRVDYNGLVIRP